MSLAAGVALLGFCLLVSALIVYFYLLLFYASIVLAFGANHTLTLDHYRVIFSEGLPAIRDTLIIALIGMPLGGIYGIVVGYLVGRTNFIGRKAMEVVSMLNYALPGTIVGIAYLLAFNDEPLALTGTAAITDRLLCVPLQPDRDPHHGGVVAADRQEHGGGLRQPRRRSA